MLSITQTIYQRLAVPNRLIATLLVVGLLLMFPNVEAAEKTAIIQVSSLNLRDRPQKTASIRRQLQKGDQVTVLATKGDWLKISFEQTTGYVRNKKDFIQVLTPEPTEKSVSPPPSEKASLENIKQKATALNQQIRQQKSKAEQFTRSEADHLSVLNKIDRALNGSRHRITALRMELSMLDDRIDKTRLAIQSLEETFHQNQTYVAKRLVALYKIRQLGTFHIMASAESMQEIVFRKSTLEHILDHDNKVRQKLVRQRMELTNLVALMNHQKSEKLAAEKSMQSELDRTATERRKRQSLLADVRAQKAMSLATLNSLKKTAQDLDRTIQKLFEQKKSPMPVSTGGVFAQSKGRLKIPVTGKIVNLFGQYRNKKFNVLNFRSGINIRADQGEPVRAVWSGKALFANWFKGYGNMLIIDHGNSYYSVYAHAQELFKKKDDMVEKGEVIATVGETGSLNGPQLYFEIRHHGRPLDPLKWIRKS